MPEDDIDLLWARRRLKRLHTLLKMLEQGDDVPDFVLERFMAEVERSIAAIRRRLAAKNN